MSFILSLLFVLQTSSGAKLYSDPNLFDNLETCGALIDMFKVMQLCHFSRNLSLCPPMSFGSQKIDSVATMQMFNLFSSAAPDSAFERSLLDAFGKKLIAAESEGLLKKKEIKEAWTSGEQFKKQAKFREKFAKLKESFQTIDWKKETKSPSQIIEESGLCDYTVVKNVCTVFTSRILGVTFARPFLENAINQESAGFKQNELSSKESKHLVTFLTDEAISTFAKPLKWGKQLFTKGYSYLKGSPKKPKCNIIEGKLSFVNWDCANDQPLYQINDNVLRFIWAEGPDYDLSQTVINRNPEVCKYYKDYLAHLLATPKVKSLSCKKESRDFNGTDGKKVNYEQLTDMKLSVEGDGRDENQVFDWDFPALDSHDKQVYVHWISEKNKEVVVAINEMQVIAGVNETRPLSRPPRQERKFVVNRLSEGSILSKNLSDESYRDLNSLKPFYTNLQLCCYQSSNPTACAKGLMEPDPSKKSEPEKEVKVKEHNQ